MADLEYAPPDPEHEALAASLPAEWVKAAESRYSMHGSGLVRNLLAGAVPLIVAAERERIRSLAGAVGAYCEGDGIEYPFADLLGEPPGPAASFSATCTGPDCGERFADSETGEYEFATRERMERLLHADGWTADPVLCPACQPEDSP